MSTTGANLQTSLAYRLGETSAPSDNTTKNIRYVWLTEGYFDLARSRNWFWQEATNTSNTNTGSTTGYAEPSDLKEFRELEINGVFYDQIPYTDRRIYTNTLGVVSLPSLRRSYKYYRYGGRYYLIPTDGNDAATHTIKYYKRVSVIDDDADTILIPDEYREALVAYAEGKYWMSITQQAKAVAPFQEYEQIVAQLEQEHNRRGVGSSGWTIHDPEDAY